MKHYNLEVLNLLVVDDNLHMHSILKAILNAMRIKNIRSCIDAADAFIEMRCLVPDIIITDWAMQPLHGIEYARLVRKGEDSPNPFVPIILLTGHTDMRRVIEARDAGVNEFLAKPVSIMSLHSRIVSIVKTPRPFIRTEMFFGPDRRRRQDPDYDGPERRLQIVVNDQVAWAERNP